MFDNMSRHFSRRGSEKDEINTTSATLGMGGFDEDPMQQYVEKDIDDVDINASTILDDFIGSLDAESGVIQNEVISASEVGDDSDFQDI